MKPVFADASFYFALSSPSDKWHNAAVTFLMGPDVKKLTSDFILVELGALMCRGKARVHFEALVERIREDKGTEVVPASRELLNAGLELFKSRSDKDWSLTDCISFAIMHEHQLSDALTSDHHFSQAGFNALLFLQ
jgi:uncharacterized protein